MSTRNEIINFEEGLFKKLRQKEAWKNISDSNNIVWDAKLIEEYKDEINWEELSSNLNVLWDIDIIEKYQSKIDWDVFSEYFFDNRSQRYSNSNSTEIDSIILKKFTHLWNWKKLSERIDFISDSILEDFSSKWDWNEIIDNRSIKWSTNRYEKFKKYIPINDLDTFMKSHLWSELVDIEEKILIGKLLSN